MLHFQVEEVERSKTQAASQHILFMLLSRRKEKANPLFPLARFSFPRITPPRWTRPTLQPSRRTRTPESRHFTLSSRSGKCHGRFSMASFFFSFFFSSDRSRALPSQTFFLERNSFSPPVSLLSLSPKQQISALLVYILCGLFSKSFVANFVVVIVLLMADFWTVSFLLQFFLSLFFPFLPPYASLSLSLSHSLSLPPKPNPKTKTK